MASSDNAADMSRTSLKRGKPPPLTEQEIVRAALGVIRAEGLDALSMRRLSRELGRSAMAPYWYVADRQQLLDLVARELLADVPVPAPDSGPWETRLREVIAAIDARLREHPGIAEVLLKRMLHIDRRLTNAMLEMLLSAGFAEADAFASYATIHTYLFGRYRVVIHQDAFTPDLTTTEDPLRRLLPELAGLRGSDFFTYGIETIVGGLRAKLDARANPKSSAHAALPSAKSTPEGTQRQCVPALTPAHSSPTTDRPSR
jgi:AcrR family transcriptional regulator